MFKFARFDADFVSNKELVTEIKAEIGKRGPFPLIAENRYLGACYLCGKTLIALHHGDEDLAALYLLNWYQMNMDQMRAENDAMIDGMYDCRRRVMEYLREEGIISFSEDPGNYIVINRTKEFG